MLSITNSLKSSFKSGLAFSHLFIESRVALNLLVTSVCAATDALSNLSITSPSPMLKFLLRTSARPDEFKNLSPTVLAPIGIVEVIKLATESAATTAGCLLRSLPPSYIALPSLSASVPIVPSLEAINNSPALRDSGAGANKFLISKSNSDNFF